MTRRRDLIGGTLAQEALGLWIGGLTVLGALLVTRTPSPPALAILLGGLGGVIALGSLVHLSRLAAIRLKSPAPGRRVDIGGYKVHVVAEGDARGAVPIVIFGGGHSAGLAMHHLHSALRQETRSILIDRPGTGWSDTGPFPRTTAVEAEEMVRALDAAGEAGPFVIVGYSFGGLLAANIARRFPERVARLVLLDPTPLETLVFGPRLKATSDMRADELKSGVAKLVGLDIDFGRRRAAKNPSHVESMRAFEAVLGLQVATQLRRGSGKAGAHIANWSILQELDGVHIGRCGWQTVVYDGDLGDLPLWLVAPGTAEEVVDEPEVGSAVAAEQARMIRFYARTRERYLAASSNSRRIISPTGSTHQFVYEHPEFVIEVLREAIRP